jgi:AraC-like DNA-binding protein
VVDFFEPSVPNARRRLRKASTRGGIVLSQDSDWAPPLRLATEELPEKDRSAIWTEEFGRTIFKAEFKPVPGKPFFQTATLRKLPGLAMITGESGPVQAFRTRQLVAEGGGGVLLQIQRASTCKISQSGREVTVGAGQAVLISGEDVTEALYPGAGLSLGIPRQALVDRLPNPEAAFMRGIPGSDEALRLLIGYLSLADTGALQTGPDTGALAALFASHVHDFCALALKPSREVLERAEAGLRAARLQGIKTDILARLGESGLSLAVVAAHLGVTPRYVQLLFKPEGITFSEFLLSARLERAWRMLGDPGSAESTIASIAYHAGFGDLSYFNRAFRKRYGMTPSETRAAAPRRILNWSSVPLSGPCDIAR